MGKKIDVIQSEHDIFADTVAAEKMELERKIMDLGSDCNKYKDMASASTVMLEDLRRDQLDLQEKLRITRINLDATKEETINAEQNYMKELEMKTLKWKESMDVVKADYEKFRDMSRTEKREFEAKIASMETKCNDSKNLVNKITNELNKVTSQYSDLQQELVDAKAKHAEDKMNEK